MIWLLVGLALARPPIDKTTPDGGKDCPGPAAPYLADIAQHGDETSYLCVITTDAYKDPLVEAIQGAAPEDPALPRYTRALALWLAARSNEPFDPDLVRLLNPADRRLLADAVKARHGRKSPAADQDAIFAKQPWYQVDKGYTDNELSDVEKKNIAVANKPPPPVPPAKPVAVEADTDVEKPLPDVAPKACGCQTTSPGSTGGLAGLLLATSWIATRVRASRSRPSAATRAPAGPAGSAGRDPARPRR